MSNMTREEFYEKYKDVVFYFESYYKYTFRFEGSYEGKAVMICVGGNSDDIYRDNFIAGCPERIISLQPFEGFCGDDSFYDY